MARSYSDADVKTLFALSAGRCASPTCRRACVEPGTPVDRHKVIGKIAHIVAHRDGGPRSDPSMNAKDRDKYENLILLCPTCHDIVDGQANHYTVALLKEWKADVEGWVGARLVQTMTTVTFVELEFVCRALLANAATASDDFRTIPIGQKIQKNGLSAAVHRQLGMGTGMARDVEDYVQHAARIDPDFPERLRAGFVDKYRELYPTAESGDSLFYGMFKFATGECPEFARMAAGLGVLTYFFVACDIFEK